MQVRCLWVGTCAEVGCIQMGEQETRPGWDLKVGEPVEEELEMAWAWLCN